MRSIKHVRPVLLVLIPAGIALGSYIIGPSTGGGTPALSQEKTVASNQVASTTVSFTSLPTVGHAVIVAVATAGVGGSRGITSVTDNQGNSYSRVQSNLPTTVQSSLWCAIALTSSGTYTVTITNDAVTTNFITAFALEYANTKCNVDQSVLATPSTSPYACGSVTTRNAKDLLLTILDYGLASGTAVFTAPSGFMIEGSSTATATQPAAVADQVVSATGTYSFAWQTAVNAGSSCVSAAFLNQ